MRNSLVTLLSAAALFCACAFPASAPPPEGAPRLVLLIVVDQLAADRLERFGAVLDGGLRRLLDEGVSFVEAHHAHAGTTTAPGHATLATGCHPSSHGIISNYWIDPQTGEEVYSAGDERYDRAPSRLECSTLGDWLKERYRESRVFSVSTKDRSAVFLGGRRADGAYWYDGEGTFVSSRYYPESDPTWLEEFNTEDLLAARFGEIWEPLPFEAETLEALGIIDYDLGPLEEDFPHAIGGLSLSPRRSFYEELVLTPWMDEHILKLARRMVVDEKLGEDSYPDLLAIGFSTTDAVGHTMGPDSREFFDVVVRLDDELGEFLDWLDQTIGLDKVAIALSSDHGSVPLPESRSAQGLPGSRAGAGEIRCVQQAEAALDARFGEADWIQPGPFFAPLPEDSAATPAEVRRMTRLLLEACPSVSRVWLAEELAREGDDEMQRRFAHSYYPGRSPDLAVQWEEYFLNYPSVASSHGTPYRYDSHVPLVLWRSTLAAASSPEPVRTVDLAPTLAAWAGAQPPAGVAGRVLIEASGQAASGASSSSP